MSESETETMVERVARALHRAEFDGTSCTAASIDADYDFPGVSAAFERRARAAIAAIEEEYEIVRKK